MQSKLLHDEMGLKTYVLVFDKGDEVREGLLGFANANRATSMVKAIMFPRLEPILKAFSLELGALPDGPAAFPNLDWHSRRHCHQ